MAAALSRLVQEAARTKAIIHLNNLVELLEVGKSIGQKQGIASFLRPAIARGELLATAECTPEQLGVIEKQDPQLLGSFAQLTLAEPGEEQTRSILLAAALSPPPTLGRPRPGKKRRVRRLTGSAKVNPIEPEAIDALDRLHRRYATYSAAPGRPLRFLRNLLEDRQPGQTLRVADVTAAFSRETGLPRFMIDDSLPLDLQATHTWFAGRVMGQVEPVDLIVDLLATVKVGLTRTDRPIASLLFVGPTGVGKTEMAKALAEYLYQDAERLVRVDMSEYADPMAVDRLIEGTSSSEGFLTRKVREHPFTVVLLDEFEKAHPRLFDLLLQVLGEGRLTDAAGRLADFRNSVVILTSNLGADGFRAARLGFGREDTAREARAYFTQQAREFLRPEMFNRLDRVVPFLPLDLATIAGIARRELKKVCSRDGICYRDLALQVDDAVIDAIAAEGYHPRYGARPLKRHIEQELVAPMAERMNEYTSLTPLDVGVRLSTARLDVRVRAADRSRSETSVIQQTLAAIGELSQLRRDAQRLEQGPSALRLRNEAYRIRQQLKRRPKARDTRGELRLQSLNQLLGRMASLLADVIAFEDAVMFEYYSGGPANLNELRRSITDTHDRLNELLLDLHLCDADQESQVTVCIFGERHEHVSALAQAYEAIAIGRRWMLVRYHLKVYRPALDESLATVQRSHRRRSAASGPRPSLTLLSRKQSDEDVQKKIVDAYAINASSSWLNLPEDAIGVALQMSGEAAFQLMEPEVGSHEFKSKAGTHRCLVETSGGRLVGYAPPPGVGRRSNFRDHPLRRGYDMAERLAFDERLKLSFQWTGPDLDDMVAQALSRLLNQRARSVLEE